MRCLVLAVALALSPAAHAADPPTTVTKIFEVADLVTPLPADQLKPTILRDGAAKLVRTVTAIVRPFSWDGQGGPGKIAYFDHNHTLVVTCTAEVMKEVSDLLGALRKLQETSVVTEVRVVSIAPGFRDRVGAKCADGTVLTEAELTALLSAAQRDRTVNVLQFPKVTTFDGQAATVRAGEQEFFVTGLDAIKLQGQTVLVPKNVPANLGYSLTVCGRVGGDGRSVNLRTSVTRTRVAGKVELTPVVTQMTPVFEGGSIGAPVPFTQYLQVPEFKTFTAERTATVPNDGTVVVGGWKETVPSAAKSVPYMNRLFTTGSVPEVREVLVLATTRVVTPGDVEVRVVAPPGISFIPAGMLLTRAVYATGKVKPVAPTPAVCPERYNPAARQEARSPFAVQEANGTTFDRTLWNWHFEPGTVTLTPAGVVKLAYLVKAVQAASGRVYLQTATDADKVSEGARQLKTETLVSLLNAKRTDVIQKKLAGHSAGCDVVLFAAVTPPPTPAPVPEEYTARTQQLLYSGEGGVPSPHAVQMKMDMAFAVVPVDFMTKIGLPADTTKDARVWTLTAREREMFAAALRNTSDCKTLSEPRIITHEGQPAAVRVGGTMSLVTGLDVSLKNGDTHVVPRTTVVDCGISAKVTPRVSADGKVVRLHLAARQATNLEAPKKHPVVIPVAAAKGKPVPVPLAIDLEELPKQDVQSIDRTFAVPESGTVVVGGIVSTTPGGKETELLIVLTPSVVKTKPEATVTPAGAELPALTSER